MLLDCGISADELDEMPNLQSRSYIKDMSYDLSCSSLSGSSGGAIIQVEYDSTQISYIGFVGGTITNIQSSGNTVTVSVLCTFSTTGKFLTVRYTRNNSTYTPPVPTVQSVINSSVYVCNTTPYELGDVNGDHSVDISDVMALSNFLVGSGSGTVILKNSDVNSDGSVDGDDLSLIYQYVGHSINHVWG